MDALSITNLEKTYKGGTRAVKNISFNVVAGDFFALLGPNGAGKSTTINITSSLVNKSSGTVKVFGKDLDKEKDEAKEYIGLVPQEFNFNIFENVLDVVVNQAGYYGVDRKTALSRAETYLKQLDLWEKRNDKSMTLSGGMKRKLMIVRALMHHPKLLILDEPTAGVDVETRRDMWEFLKDLNKEGTTIILTTHYLEEAEQLCKNIAIIDKGKMVENTSMSKLLRKLDRETFIFDLKKPISEIRLLKGYDIKKINARTLEVSISKEQDINKLLRHFDRQGVLVNSMRNKSNRLEALFLSLISEEKKNE